MEFLTNVRLSEGRYDVNYDVVVDGCDVGKDINIYVLFKQYIVIKGE